MNESFIFDWRNHWNEVDSPDIAEYLQKIKLLRKSALSQKRHRGSNTARYRSTKKRKYPFLTNRGSQNRALSQKLMKSFSKANCLTLPFLNTPKGIKELTKGSHIAFATEGSPTPQWKNFSSLTSRYCSTVIKKKPNHSKSILNQLGSDTYAKHHLNSSRAHFSMEEESAGVQEADQWVSRVKYGDYEVRDHVHQHLETIEKGKSKSFAYLEKEPEVNIQMIDMILRSNNELAPKVGLEHTKSPDRSQGSDSSGSTSPRPKHSQEPTSESSFYPENKAFMAKRLQEFVHHSPMISKRNAKRASLMFIKQKTKKIKDNIIQAPNIYYKSNKDLLMNLVLSKVTQLKKDQKFDSIPGSPRRKLKSVIEACIQSFDTFRTTFVSADQKLETEISDYVFSNLDKSLVAEFEEKTHQAFLKDMRMKYDKISRLDLDYGSLIMGIHKVNHEISEKRIQRVQILKELKKLNQGKQLFLSKKSSIMIKDEEQESTPQPASRTEKPKKTKKQKEIQSIFINLKAKNKAQRNKLSPYMQIFQRSNTVNIGSMLILKTKQKDLENNIRNITVELNTLETNLIDSTHSRDQCKLMALRIINFFLKSPHILVQIGKKLQKCIISKYSFGEKVEVNDIGGKDMTDLERKFLIRLAKIDIRWRKLRRDLSEKRRELYHGGMIGGARGVHFSGLFYPSRQESMVSQPIRHFRSPKKTQD